MTRARKPSPFEQAYASLIARANSVDIGVPGRVEAAMRAGDMAAATDPARAVDAYRLAAGIDPLDGRAAIAASAQLGRLGAMQDARVLAADAFRSALDESVRADAAFLLGELALGAEALDEALDAFQAAEQLFETLHRRDRADQSCLLAIARLNLRLTDVALIRGDLRAAGVSLPRAAAIIDALQRQCPDDEALAADARGCIDRQIDLALAVGDALGAQGWIARLLPLAQSAAAGRAPAQLRNLAALHLKESQVADHLGDSARAIAAADQAIGRSAQAANRRPQDAGLARDLARSLKRRAELDLRHGDAVYAGALAKQAIACLESLTTANLANPGLARERAALAVMAGDCAMRRVQLDEAQAHYEDARARCMAHADQRGAWPSALAVAHDRVGDVALARGDAKLARTAYAESLSLRRAALAQAGGDPSAQSKGAIAISASQLGEAALAHGDIGAARAAFRECLSIRLKLLEADDQDPVLRRQVALALERVGLAALAQGQMMEARAAFEDELALAQEDLQALPDEPGAKRFVAVVHGHLANLKEADATLHRAEALRLLESMMTKGQATAQDLTLHRQLTGI